VFRRRLQKLWFVLKISWDAKHMWPHHMCFASQAKHMWFAFHRMSLPTPREMHDSSCISHVLSVAHQPYSSFTCESHVFHLWFTCKLYVSFLYEWLHNIHPFWIIHDVVEMRDRVCLCQRLHPRALWSEDNITEISCMLSGTIAMLVWPIAFSYTLGRLYQLSWFTCYHVGPLSLHDNSCVLSWPTWVWSR